MRHRIVQGADLSDYHAPVLMESHVGHERKLDSALRGEEFFGLGG